MAKVLATTAMPGDGLQRLAQHCELDIWQQDELINKASLLERLPGCDGLVCTLTTQVRRSVLQQCPQLRFVSSMSVGVDHVDVNALSERGIPLGHTPGVLVDTTADINVGLMLAAARRIAEADQFVKQGRWSKDKPWHPTFFVGKDVSGATLGIVGLGAIGQAVAQRARGFGMEILSWTRSGRFMEGVEAVSLEDLLARSDFVSINVALTDDTRNLIDADAIATMKSDAVLVNTARGGIVDEQALADALTENRLFAAGVDVFSREPIDPDNPLLSAPNVVLAPHIGSASIATRTRMADLAADNMIAALKGERMPHCFNPEVYD
jgi:glyoxylate reductase